jgi:nitrate/nitrite transport system ATP-binding protein
MPTLNTTPTNLIQTEAPQCAPFLQIKDLSKVYPTPSGPYPVLENVNLTVCEGEFVCVIGHSGCGKSTLLNMVSGFNQPTEGEVLLEDNRITEPGPDRMVVFQNYALLPWKTAEENVYLGVNTVYNSLPEDEKHKIAKAHLELVGLTEAAKKRPTELSGGMKQRVSIARALAIRPKVLILDEPFGALDPITREELQEELLKIWQEYKVTILMITHDIDEALFLADRIVMMTNGPAATIGEILEVPFSRPRDRARVMEDPRYYELRNEALDFLYHRFAHSEDDEVSSDSNPAPKSSSKSTPAPHKGYPWFAKVSAVVGLTLAVAGATLGGYNAVTGKINKPAETDTEEVAATVAPSPTPTASPTPPPKPQPPAAITDPSQLEDLESKLFDRLDSEWQTTPTFSEALTYQVKVNPDGAIAGYEPVNPAAKEFVKEIPLSEVQNTKETGKNPQAKFKVIFSPEGILEVQPTK